MNSFNTISELIVHQSPKDARDFLENISDPERIALQKDHVPLLNIAAKHERGDMMACLVDLGFSKWQQCDKGSQFFLDALKRYLVRDLDSHFPRFYRQSKLLKSFARFSEMLDVHAPQKTEIIQDLLKQHPAWSVAMFRGPFPITNNVVDRYCSDEIFKAIQQGNVDTLRNLLGQPQSDPKKRDMPLLNIAAEAKESEIMALLIQHGASEWINSDASNDFFVRTLEIVTKKDIDIIFPKLEKGSGLRKAFNTFFGEMRKDAPSTTNAIQELLKRNRGWLISMLCRPALASTLETKLEWYNILHRWLNPPRLVVQLGHNIHWRLDTLPTESTARDTASGRPLFMDQVLIKTPVKVALPDRWNKSNLSVVELSGTTENVLGHIYSVYHEYIEENGYTLSFLGINGISDGSYSLIFGT